MITFSRAGGFFVHPEDTFLEAEDLDHWEFMDQADVQSRNVVASIEIGVQAHLHGRVDKGDEFS